MKKLLSVLLATLMLLTVIPLGALSVSAATSGGYTYTVSNGEATITDYSTSSSYGGAITIPSTLGGYPVTSIGYFAFRSCSSLTSVTIPDSVTSIGEEAFNYCYNLTSVTIGDSVTSIGSYAFSGCSSLTSVTIPDSVTSIGSYAFYNCTSLTSLTIGDSVTSIGSYAFSYCYNLTSLTIGDSVTSIGNYAFSGCSSLTSVTIPDSVTSIGLYAFESTWLLRCYRNSIAHTWAETYGRPYALIDGTDEENLVGGKAGKLSWSLDKRTSILSLTASGDMVDFSTADAPWREYKYYIFSVEMADSITSIGSRAFYDCDNLTSVTIGDSVTSIGSSAFNDCDNLTSVTIGDSVTSIGDSAFYNCDSLTSVTIGDSVTSIGDSAFSYCYNLTSVTIPDSVTSIGYGAFSKCSSLTSVIIPYKVKKIYFGCFSGCSALSSVTMYSTKCAFDDNCGLNYNHTIYGFVGSTAEVFAEKIGAEFIDVETVHTHSYSDATCTAPKICAVCGETEGEALGHSYTNECDAECDTCGESREVNGHIWAEGACSICGEASPSKVTITKEPSTGYARMGEKVSVKLTAEGEGLKYEWYIKNNGSKKYSKSSVTKSTYSTTMNDKAKDRLVFCRIYDQYGNMVQSKTVRLREAVSLTKEPATAAYAQTGKKASIKITASGDGLKYTWYIKNDGASKYSKSSVTSSTYSATMGSKVKNRRVYCIVTDKYGKTVQTKTFILREKVSITTQPKTVTVAKNKTAKVSVKASGDGLKYTWYIKNAGATKYSKSSVTSATYSTKMTNSAKNRLVYCVVTDKYGNTVKTVTIKLKMK